MRSVRQRDGRAPSREEEQETGRKKGGRGGDRAGKGWEEGRAAGTSEK